MGISKYEEMNAIQLDVIKEIGSIGNGNAATALSSMLNTKVTMPIPKVSILGFNEALHFLGDPEEVIAAIFVEMSGDIEGVMLFMLSKEFTDKVMNKMMGKKSVSLLKLDEIESSLLTEVGNIMISSYINALSSLTNLSIELSVPQMTVNMMGGILSLPMAVMGIESDRIMMITGQFIIDGQELNSDMLLLPNLESLNVLMHRLGVDK